MPDLRSRFRGADRIEPPDQWPEIVQREPHQHVPAQPRSRVLVVVFALTIGVGAVGWAVRVIGGPVSPAAHNRTSVTRIVDDGHLRCTATVPPSVLPARQLSVSLELTNISADPVQVPEGATSWSLRVTSADGDVYDSAFRSAFTPPPTPVPAPPLLPGHSTHTATDAVPVQWGGPLSVVATCAGEQLPPLSVHVTGPGPTPVASVAIRESLRRTGGLFRSCAPEEPGVPVVGRIDVPLEQGPPLVARCEASVHTYDGFDVVTLSVVAPPDAEVALPDANVYVPPTLPVHGAAEGVVWRFIVTDREATDVGGSTQSQSWSGGVAPSKRSPVPDFTWGSSGWFKGIGSCGSKLIAVGPRVGAVVQFISDCPKGP